MAEVKSQSQVKLISWPSPQDYNEAIQNLRENTQDAQLQGGQVHLTQLGLPRPLTGAFASVYRVDCGNASSVAVRCFLRDMSDQEERYQHISQFVQNDTLPYTVTFDFLRTGIRVGPNWFPALKMDWVSGPNLDHYIAHHVNMAHSLEQLAKSFHQMCNELREAGIAHGDLQHGNIILTDGELRLVDYDGMYVPAMKGMQSNEIGHRNYQHPARGAKDFGPHLDNFSAWVIYTSIRLLSIDGNLWHQLGGGDDCLLFRRDDFAHPESSFAFALLEEHQNSEIRKLAKRMRWLAHQNINDIPHLDPDLHIDESMLPTLGINHGVPKLMSRIPPSTTANLPYDLVDPDDDEIKERPVPLRNPAFMQQYEQNHAVAIEPELNQPRPRWSARRTKWAIDHTLCDQDLVENGRITRTTSFEIRKERNPQSAIDTYVLRYSYLVEGQEYFKEAALSESEAFQSASMREATVLYRHNDANLHILYFRAGYKAALVKVPLGIESELRSRKRKVVDRPRNTMSSELPLGAAALIVCALLLCLMSIVYHNTQGVSVAALMAAVGIILCIVLPDRQQELVKCGVPVQARVLEAIPVIGVQPEQMTIRYRYQSYDQRIVTRTVKIFDTTTTSLRPVVGSKITVLYDIENPENHVVYALSRYKAQ